MLDVSSLRSCASVLESWDHREKLENFQKKTFLICSHIIILLWTRCSKRRSSVKMNTLYLRRHVRFRHPTAAQCCTNYFQPYEFYFFCIINICHFQPWRIAFSVVLPCLYLCTFSSFTNILHTKKIPNPPNKSCIQTCNSPSGSKTVRKCNSSFVQGLGRLRWVCVHKLIICNTDSGENSSSRLMPTHSDGNQTG